MTADPLTPEEVAAICRAYAGLEPEEALRRYREWVRAGIGDCLRFLSSFPSRSLNERG